MTEWSTRYLAPNCDEAKFIAFLSLYGSNGVLLRDLITFATLRASGRPSKSHWLLNGEVGPILRPFGHVSLPYRCSFLEAFVRAVRHSLDVDALEERLLSLGLIEVEYPTGHSSPARDGWRTDERIWRIVENRMSSHLMVPKWRDLDGEDIIMDLLNVFVEIPSKDVSLLAERHRETFYNHARLFALETLRFNQTIMKDASDYTTALILQILTHRAQVGDEKLMQSVRASPSSTNGSDWAIMLIWAELKEVNSSRVLEINNALTNRITRLLSWKGRRQRRANGLIGYLLVEWMKAAEASGDNRLISQIGMYASHWIEAAWSSGSSIERAALCCVLANFRFLDRSILVSPEYHLLYGYYISRAGHLEQAENFLNSGLRFYSTVPNFSRLSGYRFELVSVLIRLGHRQEAERCLTDIEAHMIKEPFPWKPSGYPGFERWELQHYFDFDRWERLYEHAETKTLLKLYQAELLMAAGDLKFLAPRLEMFISTVSLMNGTRRTIVEDGRREMKDERREEGYFRSLRLALEMRILEVRTREGSPERGLKVAKALMMEIRDKPLLGPDMIQWVIQQSLTLSNRLVRADNVSDALSLLESIVEVIRYQDCPISLIGLLSYATQRIATVNSLRTVEPVENDPTVVAVESTVIGSASTAVGSESRYAPIEQPKDLDWPLAAGMRGFLSRHGSTQKPEALFEEDKYESPHPEADRERGRHTPTPSPISSHQTKKETIRLGQLRERERQESMRQEKQEAQERAQQREMANPTERQEHVMRSFWEGYREGRLQQEQRNRELPITLQEQEDSDLVTHRRQEIQQGERLATNRPTENSPPTKPILPSTTLRRGPLGKTLGQQGLRRSVATMLRRLPRVPTTHPRMLVPEIREKDSVPVSTELSNSSFVPDPPPSLSCQPVTEKPTASSLYVSS